MTPSAPDTLPPSPWLRPAWLLGALALVAVLVRAYPLLRAGAWGLPVDYDEGVYFSASALLTQGVWPYRDFVFVHPPGLLLVLAPVSAWARAVEPGTVFALARWASVAVGGANVLLLGRLAWRAWGRAAGLAAAALYALHPVCVAAEHGVFLEPSLNLFGLLCAGAGLAALQEGRRRVGLWAGVLAGGALSIKLWALAAVAGVLAAAGRRLRVGAFGAGLALALAVLVGPFALQAPGRFLEQVFAFHARRPPDGDLSRLLRMQEMFVGRGALGLALLAAVGALFAVRRWREDAAARFAFTGAVLTVGAFLAAATYWDQYNAFLAPFLCLLAALGAAQLWAGAGRFALARRGAVALAVLLAVVLEQRVVRREGRAQFFERFVPHYAPAEGADIWAMKPAP
ncbi:DUF2029 domain-containing protein [Aggregicoccus sp. 17bor-14]|uniref:glycosyltransferase 87 family protein n=1 Tax=Myxococcaceae TaxID=31 RepID=UPI00129CF794|nr:MULTISPECIES: glycosyltransferase 87 family protein [Myxococcaceae]MBF5042920.1 DUF2029 domain-containing protein [Simulacricoccus sp. 17bor-14]MRI88687.1 DUF2029 domain-containing protein [Aggregicoccus sp. 17bor-14]